MCRKVVSLAVEDAMPAMPKEEQVALKFAVLHPKPTYWWVFLIIALLIIALIVIFCLCKKSNSAATNNNVIAVRRVPDKTPNLSYEEHPITKQEKRDNSRLSAGKAKRCVNKCTRTGRDVCRHWNSRSGCYDKKH